MKRLSTSALLLTAALAATAATAHQRLQHSRPHNPQADATRRVAKAATPQLPFGDFCGDFKMYYGSYRFEIYFNSNITIERTADDSDTVTITGWWDDDMSPLEATVDTDARTITIPPQRMEWNDTGYWLRACTWNDQDATATVDPDAPIVGVLDEEGVMHFDGEWGIFRSPDGNDYYDVCHNTEIAMPNGTMTYYELPDGDEWEDDIFATIGDDSLAIHNFGGYATIFFNVDRQARTVTAAPGQAFSDASGDMYYLATVTEYEFDEDTYDEYATYVYGLKGVIEPEGDVITIADRWAFVCPDEDDPDDFWWTGCYTASTIRLPFNLLAGPVGISSPAADTAATPVEYYDLQGHRVVSPVPGIYIMRRGTSSRKVMIR